MNGVLGGLCPGVALSGNRTSAASLRRIAVATTFMIGLGIAPARAAVVGIQGTMSNFDVFNETTVSVYGAELEIEGCHPSEVMKTYPSHFNNVTMTEVPSGTTFATRITFTGYNFDPSGYMIPRVGQTTNGHFAVNLPGCEHFGFSVAAQPTATRFFWLDQNTQRIGNAPLSIPGPVWTYVPPAVPGNPPALQAVVRVPEPVEVQPRLPDSVWMKVYVTELEREVDLEELISGPVNDPSVVVPQEPAEVETEWELLEGGVDSMAEAPIGDNALAVIRRYEFYEYTGPYDPEDHSPLFQYNGGEPPPDVIGQFIAANMAAPILMVPEPSTWVLLLAGLGMVGWLARGRRRR